MDQSFAVQSSFLWFHEATATGEVAVAPFLSKKQTELDFFTLENIHEGYTEGHGQVQCCWCDTNEVYLYIYVDHGPDVQAAKNLYNKLLDWDLNKSKSWGQYITLGGKYVWNFARRNPSPP